MVSALTYIPNQYIRRKQASALGFRAHAIPIRNVCLIAFPKLAVKATKTGNVERFPDITQ